MLRSRALVLLAADGADGADEEIADSCHSGPAIAAQYEKVVTTYHASRLDLDTKEDSLNNYAGIDRRNQATAMVERWADLTLVTRDSRISSTRSSFFPPDITAPAGEADSGRSTFPPRAMCQRSPCVLRSGGDAPAGDSSQPWAPQRP